MICYRLMKFVFCFWHHFDKWITNMFFHMFVKFIIEREIEFANATMFNNNEHVDEIDDDDVILRFFWNVFVIKQNVVVIIFFIVVIIFVVMIFFCCRYLEILCCFFVCFFNVKDFSWFFFHYFVVIVVVDSWYWTWVWNLTRLIDDCFNRQIQQWFASIDERSTKSIVDDDRLNIFVADCKHDCFEIAAEIVKNIVDSKHTVD